MCMKQLPTVQFVAGLINVTLIQSGIPAGITEHWSTTLLNGTSSDSIYKSENMSICIIIDNRQDYWLSSASEFY